VKYSIDFSVFTENEAIGRISGELEFEQPPTAGDRLDLRRAPDGSSFSPSEAFDGFVIVEAFPVDGMQSVAMADVYASDRAEAEALMRYLELGFNLFPEYWDAH
jgi:hypothetical protein